jgi:hypothetical protein
MAAPMPILILSTYNDFFSYKGSKVAVNELAEMYKVLGANDRIKQFSTRGDHGMTYASIEEDVRWMSWWLKGDSSNITSDTLTTDFLTAEETFVTQTGQVLSYFKNEKSIVDYATEMFDQTKEAREGFLYGCTYNELADKCSELIGYEVADKISGGISRGIFTWEGLKVEKHLINRDRGFFLPAYIIKPDKKESDRSPAIILSGCFGKINELEANKQLVFQKLKKGFVVMVVDVTNTGELRTPEAGRTGGYEFSIAKMPVYAGKTLLGYRTEDMVIAKNYLKSIIRTDDIELLASEQTGPSAIHAAIIDKGFSKLYLKNSPHSWENLVKTHFMPDNIGIIVPCALKFYDLPDLVRSLYKRKVKIEMISDN